MRERPGRQQHHRGLAREERRGNARPLLLARRVDLVLVHEVRPEGERADALPLYEPSRLVAPMRSSSTRAGLTVVPEIDAAPIHDIAESA